MRYIWLFLPALILLAGCSSEPPAPAVDTASFNGAWNITIPDQARVWWLKVEGADTGSPAGEMVGPPGGGMYEPNSMAIEGEELVYTFEQLTYPLPGENLPYSQRPKRDATYRVKVSGDSLTGYMEVDGHPETRVDFIGVRAPEITDTDDGTWKEGEPVELFNGTDLTGWKPIVPARGFKWEVKDGVLMNDPPTSDIVSDEKFWNFKLHAEYRLYERSNSGIALRDRYEVQIAESHGKEPQKQGHGAVYYRIVPATNPSKPIGEWQTMDVTLIGRMVTVVLNGETIIDKQIIEGPTAMAHDANESEPGPISVQGDHTRVDIRKFTVTPLTQ